MNKLVLYSIVFILLATGCQYFKKEQPQDVVVQLDDKYVSKSDLLAILPKQYTADDSTRLVQTYIDQWVIDQLLMKNAQNNIAVQEQEQLEELVHKYKTQLYTQVYKEKLVQQNLDTNINKEQIKTYFDQRNEDFKLNLDLVQFNYIHLDSMYTHVDDVQKWLKSGKEEDLKKLDSLSMGFKAYFLQPEIWVKKATIYDRIPVINAHNEHKYVKDRAYWKLEDSLGVYLVRFKKVLRRGDNAPLEYITPTIKQILLNKRKLNYIKKLEKDLLHDAVQNKQLRYES